jgi:YVTN family beta-propeller protein
MRWRSFPAAVLFPLAGFGAPLLPGPQPDGSTLLHNQWRIRPAGHQITLGDFPVTVAVDPAGRYAAVLHAGWGPHSIVMVDLQSAEVVQETPIPEGFSGLTFSPGGDRLYCGGASDPVVRVFAVQGGRLAAAGEIHVPVGSGRALVGGVALSADGRSLYASVLFSSRIVKLETGTGRTAWAADLDAGRNVTDRERITPLGEVAPNDSVIPDHLITESDPRAIALDERRHRLYTTLWGLENVAVLDADTGKVVARWSCGLHPNELVLSPDGKRLFVSNGGVNTVTVLDTETGQASENLSSAFAWNDIPGVTPASLALSADGKTLYVANAETNDVAVFDVSAPAHGHCLGFIPTGWYPISVRLAEGGRRLLVLSARGLMALPNVMNERRDNPHSRIVTVDAGGDGGSERFRYDGTIYRGALALIDLPRSAGRDSALAKWTAEVKAGRPAAVPVPVDSSNPVARAAGRPSPLRHVIYIIKENRTYDQVFGDIETGNGDRSLCLFGEAVTPNLHRLARQFVLLDNFYANAEISASGHEWSMGGYSSEFVERAWPINYGHRKGQMPYPGEGGYAAAVPASGYLWDRAQEAAITYRSYGEFVHGRATPQEPSCSNLPALAGHVDPLFRGWDLDYSDLDRAARFIAELHRFERAGEMPVLQILRLPNDHTYGALQGKLTTRAMVAQNDLAVGEVAAAVSHSRFWPSTAIFIVEDDAQNGPDHVDAHRTEALVVSPYTRRHAVDSSPYTTCSMLATIESILGLAPMSQFDAAASPMYASFQAAPNLTAFQSVPAKVRLAERTLTGSKAAETSARFDFSREDAIGEEAFNRVIWASVRGDGSPMPPPRHAAFVKPLPKGGDDDDN